MTAPLPPALGALVLATSLALGGDALAAPAKPPIKLRQKGEASYYADKFRGRLTASGEKYNPKHATCAHKRLPFGTLLLVTVGPAHELPEEHRDKAGRQVTCRVNDRGPFVKGRVVDLSRSLAKTLGIIDLGVAPVEIVVRQLPDGSKPRGKTLKSKTKVKPPTKARAAPAPPQRP